jgi:hypothetical protein
MALLGNYAAHLRFTFGEFRANVPRLGIGTAWRFFLMRLSVPFGRPRRYFMRRTARSPVVNSIDASGFAELPGLEPATVNEVLDRLLVNVSGNLPNPVRSVDEYAAALRLANVERQTGLFCSGGADCVLAQVARSPLFAQLAAEYLERDPEDLIVDASVDMLVSLEGPKPAGGYDNALEFHRDIDGYRFIKMFVYLTDCYQGNGHHEMFLASHRHYPLQLAPIRRYAPEQITRYIPQAVLKRVTGPAGYAFAENTLVFHRGTAPIRSHRVILNLIYTEDSFRQYYPRAFGLLPPSSASSCGPTGR